MVSSSPSLNAPARAVVRVPSLTRVLRACLRELERSGLPRHLTQPSTAERSYLQLTPAALGCEAWLIRWPPGSSAPLHDHGSARGLAQVVRGSLHEWRCTPGTREITSRTWSPGEAIALPFGTFHEVRNLGPCDAYSVHVYDPKLDHMTFYERDSAGELRPLHREQREAW